MCDDFLFRFVCRWAGGASSSPTDKPLICALEFSFYQTVAFAAGGASRGFPEVSLRALGVPKPLPYDYVYRNRLFVRRFFVSFVCRWADDQWSPLRYTNKLPLSFYNKNPLLPLKAKGFLHIPEGNISHLRKQIFHPAGISSALRADFIEKAPLSGCFFLVLS